MKRIALLLILGMFLVTLNAFSDILVIVSKESTLSTIDKTTLSDIYMEHIRTFDNGSVAVPLNNRNMKDIFYTQITGHDKYDLQSYWSDLLFTSHGHPPVTLDNDSLILTLIARNPNMIGYVKDSSLTNHTDVKVVYTIKETDNNAP